MTAREINKIERKATGAVAAHGGQGDAATYTELVENDLPGS